VTPGKHILVVGSPFDAFDARAQGLELRDTIMHVSPEGVEPIFLFRVPLEGIVANNVLKHGTGGLDINATRIRVAGGSPSQKIREKAFRAGRAPLPGRTAKEDKVLGMIGRRGSPEAYWAKHSGEDIGRWPTNLVFTHSPKCRRNGTKKVRGTNPVHTTKSYPNRREVYQPIKDRPVTTQSDAHGNEIVEAWECVEGCPVKALDEQSLAAGVHGAGCIRNDIAGSDCGHDPKVVPFAGLCANPRPMTRFGDVGGASRFFPQFANRQELLAWLEALIG